MTKINDFLFALNEAHVRVQYNGQAIHIEGLPAGAEPIILPEVYHRGILGIFHLLEQRVPSLECIGILGIWQGSRESEEYPFCAFDLWVQSSPEEGFYLPVTSAQSLFSSHGIPYFHAPVL